MFNDGLFISLFKVGFIMDPYGRNNDFHVNI
jgi:hypothetical protein